MPFDYLCLFSLVPFSRCAFFPLCLFPGEPLNELSKRNKVTIQWIKAHHGHVGNEAADAIAKAGAKMIVHGMEPFLPVPNSFNKKVIKTHFISMWQDTWVEDPEFCKQTKLWFKHVDSRFDPLLKRGARYEVGKLVQFITGHCNLLKHQFRIGKSTNAKCRLCSKKMETPWHLATECPSLKSTREKYFHRPILHSFAWAPQILLSFCKETSIWSLLDHQE